MREQMAAMQKKARTLCIRLAVQMYILSMTKQIEMWT